MLCPDTMHCISLTTERLLVSPIHNVGALNIRLAGSSGFEGRVEHYYAGSWGTVCDTGWDMNNAKVVCRQLGLGGAVRATTGTFFGRGTGRAILSNVDCTGSETALGWCLHSGWNSRSCSQAAGVVCKGKFSCTS